MKAMVINQFGDTSVFEEMVLPLPQVVPGHVLIKVKATSVNPLDCKIRQGGTYAGLVKQFPMILHGDIAGTIEQIGDGVTQFSIGDDVYGCVGGLLDMGGGLAEYIVADENLITHKPKTLSFLEASALPLVALTAWEGLITYANTQKNQTVLIHGGTGGVGHIAIQLAKWLGAKVFSTSSSDKLELLKKIGADGAIDYQKSDVKSYVTQYTGGDGFDVVFDTVGGDNFNKCIEAAALFGKVITVIPPNNADLNAARNKGLSLLFVLQPLPLLTGERRQDYGKILAQISELVDHGAIKPLIDPQRFTVSQVGLAHAHLESGKAVGKIVLEQMSS